MLRTKIIVAAAVFSAFVAQPLGAPAPAQDANGEQPGSLLGGPREEPIQQLELQPGLLHTEYSSAAQAFAPRRLIYIVQSPDGEVLGKHGISFTGLVVDGKPTILLEREYAFPFAGRSRLAVHWENLLPLEYQLELLSAAGASGAEPQETWAVQYYYDLVAVSIKGGNYETFYSFRHPLKAYDLDELYLLFSMLAVGRLPARSVVFVTAPFKHRNYAVLLERLEREAIYAADAERHVCVHLRLTFSDFTEEFYVEALPPHRVVKFTAGELVFTLLQDETGYEQAAEPRARQTGSSPGGRF